MSEQRRKWNREDYCKHSHKRKATVLKWQLSNSEKVSLYKRKNHLWSKYKITPEQYEKMLEKQGGGCAICGRVDNGRKADRKLSVDHNHKTGKVRGIVCHRCNYRIAVFEEPYADTIRAYIEKGKHI